MLAVKDQQMAIQPDRDAVIRDAQNNVIERMKAKPEEMLATIVTTGRIEAGLTCHVQQGKFGAVADLGLGMGGDAAGPSPGFYARVGIVGCVGIAVKMLAAREGLAFRSVEVTVETDFDDGALFGLGSASAAPIETRVNIVIDSDEAEDRVRTIVDRALVMDPWFLALRDAQKVVPRVSVVGDDECGIAGD